MNIKVICVGKIKEKYFTDMIEAYTKEIRRKHTLHIIESNDEKLPKNSSEALNRCVVETESRKSLKHIEKNDYVVALCIDGQKCTTKKLRDVMDKAEEKGYEGIAFVIGGSLGMSEELVKRANFKLSFSSMTFPHQLMRVMLLDQIKQAYL